MYLISWGAKKLNKAQQVCSTKARTSLFQTLCPRRGLHGCFCKEFEGKELCLIFSPGYLTSSVPALHSGCWAAPWPPDIHPTCHPGAAHPGHRVITSNSVIITGISLFSSENAFPTSLLSWHIACADAGHSVFFFIWRTTHEITLALRSSSSAQMSQGVWGCFVVGLFWYLLYGFFGLGCFFLSTICTKER